MIVGDVVMGSDTSIWFNAVIRADLTPVRIGNLSNIQDNATVHVDKDCPVIIGEGVTVGHNAVVHGATIEDDVIVGMNATILNGAVVGRGSIIAAGALVKEGADIPERSLVVGVPGKVVKTFTEEEAQQQRRHAISYAEAAKDYARNMKAE
ncbi:MAG: gamma carbonic anhydrase family protein [Coriobacteriia bacterium]|nr:gamma carbonic anhydrase family protein [Coriobacteriia bacterium]